LKKRMSVNLFLNITKRKCQGWIKSIFFKELNHQASSWHEVVWVYCCHILTSALYTRVWWCMLLVWSKQDEPCTNNKTYQQAYTQTKTKFTTFKLKVKTSDHNREMDGPISQLRVSHHYREIDGTQKIIIAASHWLHHI
jgi:hypothetical protein